MSVIVCCKLSWCFRVGIRFGFYRRQRFLATSFYGRIFQTSLSFAAPLIVFGVCCARCFGRLRRLGYYDG